VKKCIRYFRIVAVLIALPLLAYLSAVVLLGLLPVNRNFIEPGYGIDIYLRFNPVHTDILLPVHSSVRDWNTVLHVPGIDNAAYLAFGWGDRAFFLETRTWGDLRFANAMGALLGFDSTLLHVSSEAQPLESSDMVHIRITQEQLRQLTGQIDVSMAHDARGRTRPIPGAHYDNNDGFYEALGRYSMFSTCNEWIRQLLLASGIRTAAWSPFSLALQFQAKRISKPQ
jgi:uncharacterized protein (TIGR02117 family)